MAHLPAVLDEDQFEARASVTLDGPELARFEAFANDASALIRQAAGQDFLDDQDQLDVPDGIVPVAFRVVLRAMENPLGHDSQSVGNFTWRKETGVGTSGVYLTTEDEQDIRAALDPPDTGFVPVSMSNFDLPDVS